MQNKYEVVENIKYFYREYKDKIEVCRTYTKNGKSRTYKEFKEYTVEYIYQLIIGVINSHGYEYQLTRNSIYIRLPNVVCTNVFGSTQDITDMIIQIYYKRGEIYIRGRRFSYTPEQWFSAYNHSHLSGFSNAFNSFCFGNTTPVISYFNDGYRGLFHEKLDWLLHYMPIYLSQESTNDNPYKELSKIRLAGSMTAELTLDNNYLDYLDHVILKQTVKDRQPTIAVELKDSIDDSLIEQGYAVFIDKKTGKEYLDLDFNYEPPQEDLQYNPFRFRGKNLTVTINPSKSKPEDFIKTASEKIKKQIIYKYESAINSPDFISSCII